MHSNSDDMVTMIVNEIDEIILKMEFRLERYCWYATEKNNMTKTFIKHDFQQ